MMDGKYLASNIGPLKTIGEGKVFVVINDLLNTNKFENVELVAYSIKGYESKIVTIELLLTKEGKYGPTLFFRSFDFYTRTGSVDDALMLTSQNGIGIADFEITNFIRLRDFYIEGGNEE